MAKTTELCEVQSLSTSLNLRQRTTLLTQTLQIVA